MAAQGNRCIGGGTRGAALKRGQRSGMQTRLSSARSAQGNGENAREKEKERGKVAERAALSSKSSCEGTP